MGEKTDMNRANEVRPMFRRLADVAERTGCAVILIGHLNKAAGGQSAYRGLGCLLYTSRKGMSKKVCPNCGRKMKQQFIGLQHCKCGMSWKKDIGYFERTGDMVFALERRKVGKKTKQCPVIRYR